MKVICAGASKTGTKSLAKALRILGYDPVYDVEEAVEFAFPEWEDIWYQKQPDLTKLMDTVYAKVEAIVDVPHSTFFDHFFKRWPDAKVILMTREEDAWFQSFKQICDRLIKNHGYVEWLRYFSPSLRRYLKFQEYIFASTVGSFNPHSVIWKNWYRRHNTYVRETIPQSQLLEYNVSQSWEPLCEFLDKPVPKEEFPFENRAQDIRNISDTMMEDTWPMKKAAKELKFVFAIFPVVLLAVVALYVYF